MSKRRDGSQLDLDLSGTTQRTKPISSISGNSVAPFVDAATLEIRRDALRRVAASGIFHIPGALRRG
jgi:hypothetical protein